MNRKGQGGLVAYLFWSSLGFFFGVFGCKLIGL